MLNYVGRLVLVGGLGVVSLALPEASRVPAVTLVAAFFLSLDLLGKVPRQAELLGSGLGLLGGFAAAALAAVSLPGEGLEGAVLRVGLLFAFGWAGLLAGQKFGSAARSLMPQSLFGGTLGTSASPNPIAPMAVEEMSSSGYREPPKVLDTSVIIDGRIAEIAETGFLSGPFVVPQFVLKELQQVADSSDPLKRNRGRRGLDMLQRLQKGSTPIEITDRDFPDVREVDLKLIELSLELGGRIVTNDFNLNKVAQLRGVKILNVNDLSNCLRPIVLPGEPMSIFVSKEGKEAGQGVGYLDDGTMVVVEGGRQALGKTIDVTVTTVLQTAAGKMIFVRWNDAPIEELARRDTRPGPRRTGPVDLPYRRPTGEVLPPAAGESGA